MVSIVRMNLMERKDYAPYCGSTYCMKRVGLKPDAVQFTCSCGFSTGFDIAFMSTYYKHIGRKPYISEKNPLIGYRVDIHNEDYETVGKCRILGVKGNLIKMQKLNPKTGLPIPHLIFTVDIMSAKLYAIKGR